MSDSWKRVGAHLQNICMISQVLVAPSLTLAITHLVSLIEANEANQADYIVSINKALILSRT